MIDLMVKNIFENSNRIDSIAKHINKLNKKHCILLLLIAANSYIITKAVAKHEEKINELEKKVKGMEIKSKLA